MAIQTIILAAGKGSRMNSSTSKIMHELGGSSLISRVVSTATTISDDIIVVCNEDYAQLQAHLSAYNLRFVIQKEQLGTAHALMQALPKLDENIHQQILVLYGDVPLISSSTLDKLIAITNKQAVGLLTLKTMNNCGLGRVIRDDSNKISAIVEEKDASVAEKTITEINTGIYLLPTQFLKENINNITNNNKQNEYYLTDLIKLAYKHDIGITSISASELETSGVNTKAQLANLERGLQLMQASDLLDRGVTIIDPARFDLRGKLFPDQDITIDVNVVIEGEVRIGRGSYIGPFVFLKDTTIADNVRIESHCVLEGCSIGSDCRIGPYARIRPGSNLQQNVKVGNFVELKNAKISEGSKANHLSYLGDVKIGENSNIGAGTITCNYDGKNKYYTHIGNEVFIGSNTALIAPIQLGDNSTIGASSVITKDVPANSLALSRGKQKVVSNWQRSYTHKEG